LLKPVLDGFVSSFEVTAEATDAYNDKLHARLARSVFAHCTSWYRVGGKGKVSAIFPWPTALLWWWSRRPIWDHYKVVGAERWLGSRRLMRISRILGGLLLLSAPFLWAVPMQLRKARSWPPLTGSMGLSRMIASLVRT
jgi:hypothetical protein